MTLSVNVLILIEYSMMLRMKKMAKLKLQQAEELENA